MKIGCLIGESLKFLARGFMSKTKLTALLVAVGVAFGAYSPVVAAKFTKQYEKASEILLGNGIALIQQKKFEDAIPVFEQAVVAHPKNAQAFAYLGFSHQQTDNMPEAKKYFGIALAIDPDEVRALNWGGQTDLSSEDLESALKKLDRLSRLCGDSCSEYKELFAAVDKFKAKATN